LVKEINMGVIIRDAIHSDLEEIVEAYNSSIDSRNSTCDTVCITAESREKWLKEATTTRPIWVAEVEVENKKKVVGYLSFSNFMNDRPGYSITCDMGLYINASYHGMGIGKALLGRAIEFCPESGIETIATTIFDSNEASKKLFFGFGFEQWGFMPRVARLDGVEKDLIMVGLRIENVSLVSGGK
jgi:phosphinothricin acetyltransferase